MREWNKGLYGKDALHIVAGLIEEAAEVHRIAPQAIVSRARFLAPIRREVIAKARVAGCSWRSIDRALGFTQNGAKNSMKRTEARQ